MATLRTLSPAITASVLLASLLGGCAWWNPAPPPAAPVAAPKAVVVQGEPILRSQYTFEAERAAMNAGCKGANGIRPAAKLVKRHETLEWFEVSCLSGEQRIRCEMGMCVPIR